MLDAGPGQGSRGIPSSPKLAGVRSCLVVWEPSSSAALHPASSAGSDLESKYCPRPRLPVLLMHRAGAECCRWGHQPVSLGHRASASLHRAGAHPGF